MPALQREPMKLKNVRVPGTLWNEAATIAAARGDSLGEIIRNALRQYVREAREQG